MSRATEGPRTPLITDEKGVLMNEEMSSFTPERPPEDRSRQQIQAESWKIQVIGE